MLIYFNRISNHMQWLYGGVLSVTVIAVESLLSLTPYLGKAWIHLVSVYLCVNSRGAVFFIHIEETTLCERKLWNQATFTLLKNCACVTFYWWYRSCVNVYCMRQVIKSLLSSKTYRWGGIRSREKQTNHEMIVWWGKRINNNCFLNHNISILLGICSVAY